MSMTLSAVPFNPDQDGVARAPVVQDISELDSPRSRLSFAVGGGRGLFGLETTMTAAWRSMFLPCPQSPHQLHLPVQQSARE